MTTMTDVKMKRCQIEFDNNSWQFYPAWSEARKMKDLTIDQRIFLAKLKEVMDKRVEEEVVKDDGPQSRTFATYIMKAMTVEDLDAKLAKLRASALAFINS